MRCHRCGVPLAPGVAMDKRAECRVQDDESEKVFGFNMPDGSLAKAAGRLLWVKHSKCYWIDAKHEKRSRAGAPAPAA